MNGQLHDEHDTAVADLRRVAADERTHAAQWQHERHVTAARQSARIRALGATVAHGGTVAGWVS